MQAKPGDYVQVTIYAKVKEPFPGGGGSWLDVHGVSLPAHDAQIQQVVSMDNLSPRARRIFRAIYDTKGGYLATWSLSHLLDIGSVPDPLSPRNEWDHAMRELIDAGLIEEMPDLGCRYRLVVKGENKC